jgi:hypothetical protein
LRRGSRPRSRVITTRWCRAPVVTGPAWCIEQIVAEPVAARAGFAGLVLACEPARHRWEPRAVTARAEANI